MNKSRIKILILGLFIIGKAFGQSTSLDLSQCLNYGLEHSPYMTLSENELAIFKYNKRDMISSYLPSINASGQLDYNAKLPVTVIPAGEFAPQEIRMKMGSPHSNQGVIQLEQTIYDHSAIVGINGIKSYEEISGLNAEKYKEDLIYDIASAYYRVLVVEQQINLLLDSKAQYEELERIMALRLEKGVITQVDYNRIKVASNNIESQLSLVERGKNDALNYLKMVMGMPLDTDFNIKEISLLDEMSIPMDEQNNVSNRLDLKIMQKNMELQKININVTKYSALPTLSGYARYGANSYAENFVDSWKNFNDFASIGLSLKIPIFNGLKINNAYNKAKIQLENMQAQTLIMEEGFKMELLNAKSKMIEARTSLEINEMNMQLAKEVYEQTNLAYQKGMAGLSDFLNADFSYKEAQTNYLTSLVNLLSSRLDYEKSKGNLVNYLNDK